MTVVAAPLELEATVPVNGEDRELRYLAERIDALNSTVERLDTTVGKLGERLDDAVSEQARQRQTLYGVDGRNGLRHDVRDLKERSQAAGMVSTRTMVTVIGVVVAAFGALIGLVVSLL